MKRVLTAVAMLALAGCHQVPSSSPAAKAFGAAIVGISGELPRCADGARECIRAGGRRAGVADGMELRERNGSDCEKPAQASRVHVRRERA